MNDYTVLARKYRPQTFEEVVGQEHVVQAMKNSILNHKLHSVYLLSGTRGVGKTTIARIFTKAMNCENFDKHQEPCETCSSCKSIDEGRCIDLLEVDAASQTGVNETRNMIESLNYTPQENQYKVFIIDEVHMLSIHSFNALLKTLEEPPEYAKFLLCTTDPQKIPATVLSRCLHFHLKPLTPDQIDKQLTKILQKEKIFAEPEATRILANAANGSMRDCLSLADQAIAIGNQKVTKESVQAMLGIVDDSYPTELIVTLLNPYLDNRNTKALELFDEINKQQTNWFDVTNQILDIIFNLNLLAVSPDNAQLFQDLGNLTLKRFFETSQINKNTLIENAQLLYEIFSHSLRTLQYSNYPQQVVKLAVIRALGFMPNQQLEANYAPVEKPRKSSKRANKHAPRSISLGKANQANRKVNTDLLDSKNFQIKDNQTQNTLSSATNLITKQNNPTQDRQASQAPKNLSSLESSLQQKHQDSLVQGGNNQFGTTSFGELNLQNSTSPKPNSFTSTPNSPLGSPEFNNELNSQFNTPFNNGLHNSQVQASASGNGSFSQANQGFLTHGLDLAGFDDQSGKALQGENTLNTNLLSNSQGEQTPLNLPSSQELNSQDSLNATQEAASDSKDSQASSNPSSSPDENQGGEPVKFLNPQNQHTESRVSLSQADSLHKTNDFVQKTDVHKAANEELFINANLQAIASQGDIYLTNDFDNYYSQMNKKLEDFKLGLALFDQGKTTKDIVNKKQIEQLDLVYQTLTTQEYDLNKSRIFHLILDSMEQILGDRLLTTKQNSTANNSSASSNALNSQDNSQTLEDFKYLYLDLKHFLEQAVNDFVQGIPSFEYIRKFGFNDDCFAYLKGLHFYIDQENKIFYLESFDSAKAHQTELDDYAGAIETKVAEFGYKTIDKHQDPNLAHHAYVSLQDDTLEHLKLTTQKLLTKLQNFQID